MKLISIYDNGGKTIDRFTAVTDENDGNGYNAMLSVNIDGDEMGWGGGVEGRHLGRYTTLEEVPQSVAAAILKAIYWRES